MLLGDGSATYLAHNGRSYRRVQPMCDRLTTIHRLSNDNTHELIAVPPTIPPERSLRVRALGQALSLAASPHSASSHAWTRRAGSGDRGADGVNTQELVVVEKRQRIHVQVQEHADDVTAVGRRPVRCLPTCVVNRPVVRIVAPPLVGRSNVRGSRLSDSHVCLYGDFPC